MNFQEMLFEFIGGLGIFIFGLNFMGDGLQKVAGDNLRSILNKFTSTPFRAILAGAVVTVLIQSSSATTVLTVGLVSAGFMSLTQAIGVIMGSNIGTTITAFIIGFNVGAYALPIIAIGSLALSFSKKPSVHNVGKIIFGFGALFLGLELMGGGMAPLENLPQFRHLMVKFSSNPILGVSVGTLLTLVVQSSSAMIGITQEMYSHGTMTLDAALPLLFGSNIGTTITAILAAIGTSIVAKRTAASHTIFNLLGTIIVMLLLKPFTALIVAITGVFNLSPAMQLAFAHGLFNVLNVLIQMWFISQIAALVTKIVPGEDEILGYDDSRLDRTLVHASPNMALNQVKLELGYMGEVVMDGFDSVYNYFKTRNEDEYDNVMRLEQIIDDIDLKLIEYLMLISTEEMVLSSSNEHTTLVDVTKYLERIGDHGENILIKIKEADALARTNKRNKEDIDSLYDDDIVEMFHLIKQNISDAIEAFTTDNEELVENVLDREKKINEMEIHLRKKYVTRLNQGKVTPADGIMFVDIVSNLERMSDHAVKIAKNVTRERYPFQNPQAQELATETEN